MDKQKNSKKFLLELKQINANRKINEKDWNSSLIQLNKLLQNDLQEIENKLDKEFHNELKKIQMNIKKIQCKVNEFKHELSRNGTVPNVNRIKSLMEATESVITEFKESQQKVFAELLKDEKTCDNEIALINARIEALAQPTSQKVVKTSGKTSNLQSMLKDNNLPPAILKFQRFVDAHGTTGGWDDQDHSTFVKLAKKYKGPPNRFSEFVKSCMPFRTVEDISAHSQWYKKYQDFKRDKTRAIENWRIQKEEENKQNAVAESVEIKISSTKKISEKEQAKKRQLIAEWKKAKLEEEEAQRFQKFQRETKQREIERIRQAELRKEQEEILTKLRAKREKEQREEWAKEMEQQLVEEDRRRQASTYMKKFQTRDQMILEHKMHVKKLKEKEIEIAKQKLERTKERVFVPHDSNRLYELTEACIQRQNASDDDSVKVLNRIPHRAVPGWRQQL